MGGIGSGGKRPGAGRPKGAQNKPTTPQSLNSSKCPADLVEARRQTETLAQQVRWKVWQKLDGEIDRWDELTATERRGLIKVAMQYVEPRTPLVTVTNNNLSVSPAEVIRERLAAIAEAQASPTFGQSGATYRPAAQIHGAESDGDGWDLGAEELDGGPHGTVVTISSHRMDVPDPLVVDADPEEVEPVELVQTPRRSTSSRIYGVRGQA